MRRLFISGVALLALGGTASAAELTGYITYIAPDEDMFVVDNGNRFTVGAGLDKATLKLGARVDVTYEGEGAQMTASAVEILPLVTAPGATPQAPVAGAAGGADAAAGGGAAGAAGGALGGAAGGAMGVAPGVPAAPAPAPAP